MTLEHFDYEGISAYKATDELTNLGLKILDYMLNCIIVLQRCDSNVKPRIKANLDLHTFYRKLWQIQVHYQSIPFLKTRGAARQTYFQHGRLFNVSKLLADLKTRHIRIFTTGSFSLDECLEALEMAQQIRRVVNNLDMPEFSIMTDEVILLINELSQNIENFEQLFPGIDPSVNALDFSKFYSQKVHKYLDEIIKTLALSGLQCIDESLRKAQIFLRESDCVHDKALSLKIPTVMQKEKQAFDRIVEHISGNEYHASDLFRVLLIKVKSVLSQHRNIDSIAKDTNTKVTRVAYYQQDLDKACFFNIGLCYGAAKTLIEQDIRSNAASCKPSSTPKYNDLHNCIADVNIFTTQNSHFEFVDDFPETLESSEKTYNTRNFDLEDFGTLDTLETFATSLLEDVDRHSESAFAAGLTRGPYVYISLLNDTGIGHVLGIQKCKHSPGKYFYRLIDYNAGQFLIGIDPNKNTIHEWLALYFSHLAYEKYNRYQLKVSTPKIPTDQDKEDFKNRAKLRALFITLDNVLHSDDCASVLHQILDTYELIHSKHIYDHYAVWTRVSASLNMPLDNANIRMNKSLPFFCHMSFVILVRCKEHDIFKPTYNAHKFLSLKSTLIIALNKKHDKVAKYLIKEIIGILSLNILQGAEKEALEFFNELACIDLKNFSDLYKLTQLTDTLISSYFDPQQNVELQHVAEQYCNPDADELKVSIDTLFFSPTAPDEYAFYYSALFNQHATQLNAAPTCLTVATAAANPKYKLPMLNMFTLSPTRYLRPAATIVPLHKGMPLALENSTEPERLNKSYLQRVI